MSSDSYHTPKFSPISCVTFDLLARWCTLRNSICASVELRVLLASVKGEFSGGWRPAALAGQTCSSTLAALRAATLVCTPGGWVAARLEPWLGPGLVLGSLDIAFFSCAHRTVPCPSPSAEGALWCAMGSEHTVTGSMRRRSGSQSVSAEANAAAARADRFRAPLHANLLTNLRNHPEALAPEPRANSTHCHETCIPDAAAPCAQAAMTATRRIQT